MNINYTNGVSSDTRIADFGAGDSFIFNGSTKGNNGLCIRVADSKAGKARFVNLESGKLLKASDDDRGVAADVYVEV